MPKRGRTSRRGFGLAAASIAVVVLAGLGAAYAIHQRNENRAAAARTPEQKALHAALKNASCEYDDADLCKFFASQNQNAAHTITIVNTQQNGSSTSTLVETESPTRTHFSVRGTIPYETIMLDQVLYTRVDNKLWWKQALPADAHEKLTDTPGHFAQPTSVNSDDEVRISYKKLGQEPCGNLTCFKYELNDSSAPENSRELLWFDTGEYRVRRTLSTTTVSSSDAAFSYQAVAVKAPTKARELGPNQYLVPGQEEPMTVPADGLNQEQIEALIEQYADYSAGN
jgi:hypothetical protein